MSPDLIAFLKAWHHWATNGAPEGEPFSRSIGLCDNSDAYANRECIRNDALYWQLRDLLPAVTVSLYPFGQRDYHARRDTATQHECPKRLAWVREKLVEAGELVA